MRTRTALLAAAAVMSLVPLARAAEYPYDFVVCTTGKHSPVLQADASIYATGIENWGVVASSTTPTFEKASTHCTGFIRVMNNQVVGKGVCKWTDTAGDSAIVEFEYPDGGGEPRSKWLTGTGKFKGIGGGGTFREQFSAKSADPAMTGGCRRDWGKYTLP